MGAQIPDVLSSGASIWLRVIAWIFKLSGSLFAFVAFFGLIPLVLGWTASADSPGYALSFLLSMAMAGALFATGVLLARRERAGALLALVLTLYPLAFVLAGQRPLARSDVIVTVVTVAVIASIWPQLSARRQSTPAK
jgi:hypothetical protein